MKKKALVMLAAVAMAASVAQATPILEDNFDTLGPADATKYANLPTGAGLEFDAVANTVFGGSSNLGMLKVVDTSTSLNISVNTKMSGQSITAGWISLDLYDVGSNASTSDFLRITLTGTNANVSFDDGKINGLAGNNNTGFSVASVAPVSIYFNTTASTVSLNGVSVLPGKLLVYNGSTLAMTGANAITGALTNVNFGTNAGDANAAFYADNFAINTVPEPMGASLFAMTAGAMLLRRRA